MANTCCTGYRLLFVTAVLLTSTATRAQPGADLTELSFEELMDVEITSVSRHSQPLSEAAAVVFVISNEDLRRSGATSIPEALRMVPGMQVAQIESNKWSVSARGFAGRFANKLLVLVDGRTVYTPGFSGVYWEQLDLVLEDIERIEVIRGPGATLWGANAVNGVINIITKSAVDTQGGLALIGVGNEERLGGTLRYGEEMAAGVHGRAYVNYAEKDEMVTVSGEAAADAWNIRQGGFRVDSEPTSGDRLSLQGDVYRGDYDQHVRVPTLTPPTYTDTFHDTAEGSGWNLLGRLDHPLSVSSDFTLQLYYDHYERKEAALVWQDFDTFDIDFQHHSRLAERHNLIWGLGYRGVRASTRSTEYVSSDFDSLTTELWSGFIQDELELIEDKLRLTLGSKFEHNDMTGFEYQPNVRLLWQLEQDKVLWAAVSRAVRTPSIGERHWGSDTLTIPPMLPPYNSPLPILIVSQGNNDFETEELLAYEVGFRINPQPTLSLDLALFFNEYDNLRSVEASLPQMADDGPYLVLESPMANKGHGSVYGLELAADWLVRKDWRLALAYSFAEADLKTDADSVDRYNALLEENLPRHQLSLRSLKNLRPDIDFDLWLRYVDESYTMRPDAFFGSATIDGYWDLDLRLAWRPVKRIELALVGQNLLQDSRFEGTQESFSAADSEVQRGVYGTVKIDF